MKKFYFTGLLMLLCLSSTAQKNSGIRMNAIDLGTGATLAYVNIYEHPGVKTFSTGIDFSLRYTRFFDAHWGAFVQGGLSYNSAPRKTYFNKVDALDGNRYTYNWFKTGSTTQGRSYLGGFIGGVYRLDINRWSLRPRLGIGAAEYYLQRSRYYITPKSGDDAARQAVLILPDKNEDNASISRTLAAGKAGMQFMYSITDYFHLGLDIDLTFFISRHEYTVRKYDTKKKDRDINDAIGAILTMGLSTLSEDYERTDMVSETRANTLVPPVASIKFSLGWDF